MSACTLLRASEYLVSLIVYPAVITDEAELHITALFPDFGGLIVSAQSPAELLQVGRQRLSQVLKELEKAGDSWPRASTMAELRAARPIEALSIVWIDVTVEDTPIRVTISLGERLLAQIDSAAEGYALTRSGFLAAYARRQIASGVSPLSSDAGQRLADDMAAAGRVIQDVLGPGSPVGRTLAEFDSIAVDGLRRMAGGVSSAIRRHKKPASTGADTEGRPPE